MHTHTDYKHTLCTDTHTHTRRQAAGCEKPYVLPFSDPGEALHIILISPTVEISKEESNNGHLFYYDLSHQTCRQIGTNWEMRENQFAQTQKAIKAPAVAGFWGRL